ncbi:hypothetical protein MANAM107_24720 [Actinomyces capricornis]|uniref:HNH endonuclease n=1 Tax=Actinomyces capricornis TaxID=2755559 RepID=A0ABN6K8J4_9ACTO|nr:hypothetical protein MANAM107_24720 [Actinomyces capricornis]
MDVCGQQKRPEIDARADTRFDLRSCPDWVTILWAMADPDPTLGTPEGNNKITCYELHHISPALRDGQAGGRQMAGRPLAGSQAAPGPMSLATCMVR